GFVRTESTVSIDELAERAGEEDVEVVAPEEALLGHLGDHLGEEDGPLLTEEPKLSLLLRLVEDADDVGQERRRPREAALRAGVQEGELPAEKQQRLAPVRLAEVAALDDALGDEPRRRVKERRAGFAVLRLGDEKPEPGQVLLESGVQELISAARAFA